MEHLSADTTYRIVPIDGGSFGIEVAAPGTRPAIMVPFETKVAADNWIAEHKNRRAVRRADA
jgi:hypothetical protein